MFYYNKLVNRRAEILIGNMISKHFTSKIENMTHLFTTAIMKIREIDFIGSKSFA